MPEQVGDAIALASAQEDLRRIGDCIPSTLLSMLHSEATPVFGDYSSDAAAWRLAGCLGLGPGQLVPCARLYVIRANAEEAFWRITAPVLFEAVLNCRPATASQSEFFAWLRRDYTTHWSPALDTLQRQARAAEAVAETQRDPRLPSISGQPVLEPDRGQLAPAQGASVATVGGDDAYLPARTAQNSIDDFIPKTPVLT